MKNRKCVLMFRVNFVIHLVILNVFMRFSAISVYMNMLENNMLQFIEHIEKCTIRDIYIYIYIYMSALIHPEHKNRK